MFEILREFFLMMILRKKIVKKEQDAAHSSSGRLGTNREPGDDGVIKMWIERVSDIVKSNKL